MWSDDTIDNAFQRLNPPEPEPTPFPLDAWLRLESQLDQAVIERAVRRRLWQFFAAEMAAVLLVALGWLLWPAGALAPTRRAAPTTVATVLPPQLPGAPAVAPAATASAATGAARVAPKASPPAPAPTEHLAIMSVPHELVAVPGTKAAVVLQPASSDTAPAATPSQPNHFSPPPRLTKGLATGLAKAGQRTESPLSRTAPVEAAPATAEPLAASAASVLAQAATTAAAAVSPATSAASGAEGRRLSPTQPGPGLPSLRSATADAAGQAVAAAVNDDEAAAAATTVNDLAAALAGDGLADDLRPLPAAPLPAPVATALPTVLASVATAPVTGLPRPVRQPRFYVGVVAAPDVSTVKFDGLGKPCLNLGLTLDIRLGNHLRLSTGLLRASKKYVTRRENYDWGAFQARVFSRDFTDVESVCTVLDVPLNLRYDLLVRPSYRLVGTAGLSSLFLQRESYYYDWTDATGPHTWTGSAVNQNQHPLSILNLAAGVEYGLGTRWDLLAEPYVKVPLAGVGLGKVKLLSAGVLFGLKYGF